MVVRHWKAVAKVVAKAEEREGGTEGERAEGVRSPLGSIAAVNRQH
jgi:hypothetical protein